MSKKITYNDYQKGVIFTKYNGMCAICGQPLTCKTMTVSHKLPLSRGGTNNINNLMLSCLYCNHAKQNLTMDEFLKQLWEILQYNEEKVLELVENDKN